MKSIGELINEFEQLDIQNVGEFNRLFPTNKLGEYIYQEDINSYKFEEYPNEWSVEVLGVAPNDNRWILLNNQREFIHELRRDFRHEKRKHGNSRTVTVMGETFKGVMVAARNYGLSVDQFYRRFSEVEKDKYELIQGA